MPHPLAGAALTALLAGATSLVGVWVLGQRVRYLRFWASAWLTWARVLVFAIHAGVGLLAWKLATDHGWVPARNPSLWPLDALAYAGIAEAAFRADWAGMWLEPGEGAWSVVRGVDRLLGKAVRHRALKAQDRVVQSLGDRDLIREASRLLADGYGVRPADPVGIALWTQLADNIDVIDRLGPLGGRRTFAQEAELSAANTAVVKLVLDRIDAQGDTLGAADGRARDLVYVRQLARPSRRWP